MVRWTNGEKSIDKGCRMVCVQADAGALVSESSECAERLQRVDVAHVSTANSKEQAGPRLL